MAQALKENFCANLSAARKRLGLTQLELAERLEVQRAYVTQVENGRHSPTLDLVDRFADALGIPAHELLSPPGKFLIAS